MTAHGRRLVLCIWIAGSLLGGAMADQPEPIRWTAGDGAWEEPANWSGQRVPGASDDVAIENLPPPVVTIGQGDQSVWRLQSSGDLSLTGGTLTVGAGGGSISRALSIGPGQWLKADGGSFAAGGATTAEAASLYAEGGGTLALPSLATFFVSRDFKAIFQADGAGSLLDLSSLAEFTPTPCVSSWRAGRSARARRPPALAASC